MSGVFGLSSGFFWGFYGVYITRSWVYGATMGVMGERQGIGSIGRIGLHLNLGQNLGVWRTYGMSLAEC